MLSVPKVLLEPDSSGSILGIYIIKIDTGVIDSNRQLGASPFPASRDGLHVCALNASFIRKGGFR